MEGGKGYKHASVRLDGKEDEMDNLVRSGKTMGKQVRIEKNASPVVQNASKIFQKGSPLGGKKRNGRGL